jgi:hypothetical protein
LSKENTEKDVTKVRVFLLPDSKHTARSLHFHVRGITPHVKAYLKCNGFILEGKQEHVNKCIDALRKIDPSRIFIRICGPPLKGSRIFKGFLQQSAEYAQILPLVSEALRKIPDTGQRHTARGSQRGQDRKPLSFRVVRCEYVHEYIEALLIDYGKPKPEVRCPVMFTSGKPVCEGRCPYGDLNIWA